MDVKLAFLWPEIALFITTCFAMILGQSRFRDSRNLVPWIAGIGVIMVRAVRERHDGVKRSPWNEAECGNHYARSLAETSIKVNGAAPGHVATDLNAFRGPRTPEQGAVVAIRRAQLDSDGPTGLVFEDETQLMW